MMKFENWYEKNYKKILIVPAIVLTLSIIYVMFFYFSTGDFIHKDVSLTGGTTITVETKMNSDDIEKALSEKIKDFEIRALSDNSGRQFAVAVMVKEGNEEKLKNALEEILGFKLTEENSSIESTSSTLSEDFYKQLIVAIILAFFWMASVVFIIFTKGAKLKTLVIIVNILFGFYMGNFFLRFSWIISAVVFVAFSVFLVRIYIKKSVPAFAVMLSAFGDIVMTLAVINLIGMELSVAGIVAFLMLIGYSVDTDILLTTRLLKKKDSINRALYESFKTGTTMTMTSIIAIAAALIVVFNFDTVLNQIFTILLIGLGFDLFNTWITNASIIKWYVEEKSETNI